MQWFFKMTFRCSLKDHIFLNMPHTASKIINECVVLLPNMILNDGVDEAIHPNIMYEGIFENQPYFDD